MGTLSEEVRTDVLCGHICDLEAENAKLRELAKLYAKVIEGDGCYYCPYCDPDLCDEETDPMKDGCRLYDELRELGVTDD